MRNERSIRVFIDFHSSEHALLQLQFSAHVEGVHCGSRVRTALVALENECCWLSNSYKREALLEVEMHGKALPYCDSQ